MFLLWRIYHWLKKRTPNSASRTFLDRFLVLVHSFYSGSNHRGMIEKEMPLSYLSEIFIHFSQCFFRYIPADMDASKMHLWGVSYSISETSQRGLICKSLRRFPGDWLKTSPEKCLWDFSEFLRGVFKLHLRLLFLTFKLRHCTSKAWLPVHLSTSLHNFW